MHLQVSQIHASAVLFLEFFIEQENPAQAGFATNSVRSFVRLLFPRHCGFHLTKLHLTVSQSRSSAVLFIIFLSYLITFSVVREPSV